LDSTAFVWRTPVASAKRLDDIAAQLNSELDIATGKWFGKPCIKVGGKVAVVLWGDDLAFKLAEEAHFEARQVEGARLFDPRGQGHPMKEWVQIPASQSSTWSRFASLACENVAGAAQAKKERIVSDLIETRRRILDVAASLPPTRQEEIFLGSWSARDLLAHLVGWDLANLDAIKGILAGTLPEFYSYYDRDWRIFNARLVAEHNRGSFADLLSSVEDSHQKLIEFLNTVAGEEFDRDRGVRFKGYKVTIARTLQSEIDDEKTHHTQLRMFTDRFNPA
jgi:hypothetical protein